MKGTGRQIRLAATKNGSHSRSILARCVAQGNVELALFGSPMKSNYEFLVFCFPQEDVGGVVGGKMPQLSGTQRCVLVPEPQESLYVGEDFLLSGGSSIGCKRICWIFLPAAGEIAAIVWVASSGHGDFITIIEFRNAAKRKRQAERELHLGDRRSGHACKTRHIVICKEGHEKIRVRVQRILAQDIGEISGRRSPEQNLAKREIGREIEYGGELSVDAIPTLAAAHEKGSDGRFGVEDFADGGEPRIVFPQARVPFRPKLSRNIGKCVEAVAIQT